jgi:hypothetical protein
MKPVITEEATQRLRNIIEETERSFNNEISITPGEAKRIELIRRMKEDTDKHDYMIMLNVLIGVLCLSALVHYFYFGSFLSLIAFVSGLMYFLFIRFRLKTVTQKLIEYKHDFDKYLWEGYYLKEMRFSALKLAFIIFYPLVIILISDLVSGEYNTLPTWLSIVIAIGISTVGWLIYFNDDKSVLDTIEDDLNSLQYL